MIILQSESFLYFIIFHRDTHNYHVTITFASWVTRSNISLYSTGKTAVSQMILCACEISIQTRFWRHIGKKSSSGTQKFELWTDQKQTGDACRIKMRENDIHQFYKNYYALCW